ncbi:MAG: hypothetical protein LQ346_002013 [Caloplaca aetnensis]|nr:MAG: hypothetical protein LQ346_002013 [Caloplaca aetnensis]
MVDIALAAAGLAIGGPPLVGNFLSAVTYLRSRAEYHRNINDHVLLCEQIINLTQGASIDLLFYFERLGDTIPERLRYDVRDLFQALRSIHENISATFPNPPSSLNPSSKPRRLHAREAKRLAEETKRLEEWSNRFLKRAIEHLFFGPISTPAQSERERLLRSYDALDRVAKLRAAVQETLTEASTSIASASPLFLQEVHEGTTRTLLHTDPSDSLLWQLFPADTQLPTALLVEYRAYSADIDTSALNALRRTVRAVAAILHHADPENMGLLKCRGFAHNPDRCRFELHFLQPPGWTNPRSLRNLLRDPVNAQIGGAVHPLNQRVQLARTLAEAIFYVHSGDWVHKNIRPDNIIVFEQAELMPGDRTGYDNEAGQQTHQQQRKYRVFPRSLGKAFLVGYDGVRKLEAESQRLDTDDWRKKIYLSPERHRLSVGDEFTMAHDVYSLGVVLLEVALWRDLTNRALRRMFWRDAQNLKSSEDMRAALIKSAKTDVPRVLGQKYADAVVACLTGLREEEEAGILADVDGVITGTAYITQILKRLEEISI